jgi:hypothetical protein
MFAPEKRCLPPPRSIGCKSPFPLKIARMEAASESVAPPAPAPAFIVQFSAGVMAQMTRIASLLTRSDPVAFD